MKLYYLLTKITKFQVWDKVGVSDFTHFYNSALKAIIKFLPGETIPDEYGL